MAFSGILIEMYTNEMCVVTEGERFGGKWIRRYVYLLIKMEMC
jgi:hypothetical protein